MDIIILNKDQENAILKIKNFLKSENKVFFLKGYAGTGKTTIIKKLLSENPKTEFKLLATTGIAAKIMSKKTQKEAKTIHKEIFNIEELKRLEEQMYQKKFFIKSLIDNVVYIIDESSMIGDLKKINEKKEKQFLYFGSTRLLKDFFEAINLRNGPTKVIFVGDPVQLPPVGEDESPALDKLYIKEIYGFTSEEFLLEKIERQKEGDGILFNSLKLRELITDKSLEKKFQINFNFNNINILEKNNVASKYLLKMSDTLIITYSNKEALNYCRDIRNLKYKEYAKSEILIGEKLMIVQNDNNKGNYSLMNGEKIEVLEVYPDTRLKKSIFLKALSKIITLEFIDVKILLPDSTKETKKIFLNYLNDSEYPSSNISTENALIEMVKKDLNKNNITESDLQNSQYYNALKVRYAYAITCHKAQGSETDNVIIDCSNYNSMSNFKWMYTAFTRAKKNIYIVMENLSLLNDMKLENKEFSNFNRQVIEENKILNSSVKKNIKYFNRQVIEENKVLNSSIKKKINYFKG